MNSTTVKIKGEYNLIHQAFDERAENAKKMWSEVGQRYRNQNLNYTDRGIEVERVERVEMLLTLHASVLWTPTAGESLLLLYWLTSTYRRSGEKMETTSHWAASHATVHITERVKATCLLNNFISFSYLDSFHLLQSESGCLLFI